MASGDVEKPKTEEEALENMLCCNFCVRCQEIFTGDIDRLDRSRWISHHRNLSEIKRAVQEGCYICSRSWKNATLDNPKFFEFIPETSMPNFSMRYQISFEHEARYSSLDGPHNTIRIVLHCNREEDGRPVIRHNDNFLAFSSKGKCRYTHTLFFLR